MPSDTKITAEEEQTFLGVDKNGLSISTKKEKRATYLICLKDSSMISKLPQIRTQK